MTVAIARQPSGLGCSSGPGFRTLSEEQLKTAERILDQFRDKELQPEHLADAVVRYVAGQ